MPGHSLFFAIALVLSSILLSTCSARNSAVNAPAPPVSAHLEAVGICNTAFESPTLLELSWNTTPKQFVHTQVQLSCYHHGFENDLYAQFEELKERKWIVVPASSELTYPMARTAYALDIAEIRYDAEAQRVTVAVGGCVPGLNYFARVVQPPGAAWEVTASIPICTNDGDDG